MPTQPILLEPYNLDRLPQGVAVFDDSVVATQAVKMNKCLVALVNLRKNAENLDKVTVRNMRRHLYKNGMWWTAANVRRLCRKGNFKALAAAHVIKTDLRGTIEMGTRGTLSEPYIHTDTFDGTKDYPVYTATARQTANDDVGTISIMHRGRVFTGGSVDAYMLLRDGEAVGRFTPEGFGTVIFGSEVPHTGGFTNMPTGQPVFSLLNGKLRPLPPAGARRPFFSATNFRAGR